MILFIQFKYRAETPPNTPQRARASARENERNSRNLDTPQHRRTPHGAIQPQIVPLQFNNAPIPPVPAPAYHPIIQDDPFAPLAGPVHHNGQQFNNLPQYLAHQLQNLPPLPAAGHGRGHLPPVGLDFLL